MNPLHINIETFASRTPSLADQMKQGGGGLLSIGTARNGIPTAEWHSRRIHSAYDPVREAHTWAEAQTVSDHSRETVVVFGIGLLYHVEALQQRIPPDTHLAVVVPDLRELYDACSARLLISCIKKATWLTGPPEAVAKNLSDMDTPLRFISYSPAMSPHADYYAALEEDLRRRVAAQAGGQLTVAVIGPIYGGSLPVSRYAVRALEELGHRVRWIDHSLHARSYESFGKVADTRNRLLIQGRFADLLGQSTLVQLAEDPPDLVLALAQAPLTSAVLEHLRRKKFLTAMWFVENYRHLTYWQQMASTYDFWFVIQKKNCIDALRHAGAREVAYLPMAADPLTHRPLILSEEERGEYGSDLSFVGAGYPNRRNLLSRLLSSEWTFKIWGNEWDGAQSLHGILQRNASRIDTETCMKVFNASRINLNIHSYNGEGLDPEADFVNPRTFELAACGAFQLMDERSLRSELFSNHEIATFQQFDRTPGMIRSWLGDSDARQSMALAARRRVLADHTYTHRMKDMLAHVGMSQPDRIGTLLRGQRQACALAARSEDVPVLSSLFRDFPAGERVELKEVAGRIRSKGRTASLVKEELLILMLDEYRAEMRDVL